MSAVVDEPIAATLVGDVLREAAARYPDRDAYVHREKRSTYAWLDRAADGFAATLLERGVRKGDVVCLLLQSSTKFAACYAGMLRVGAIASAINPRLGVAERTSIFARTTPALTVLGDGLAVPEAADAGAVLPVSELKEAFAADPPARFPRLDPSDPTCIVWTSGTSGAPKGAVYDHAAQQAIARNIVGLAAMGDRRLWVTPMPHVGYMTRFYHEIAHASTLVLVLEPWSPEEALEAIERERVTVATGVPTQWSLLVQHPKTRTTDMSSLRLVSMGGGPVPPDLVRRVRDLFGCGVMNRYTSTEAGLTTATVPGDPDEVVALTVGRPGPDVEVRTVDPASGAPVAAGAVGEVVCRSACRMREYWRDPELTARVIDADGWLHTGDLGTFGDDGNVRLVGRLKEMYIRGGYNVYPSEVEDALTDHPAIARAAVVGIPDPTFGEIGVAYVVPATASDALLTADDVRAWCRARLADYKAPDRVIVVEEFPLTSMLKVDKRALVERAIEERTSEASR